MLWDIGDKHYTEFSMQGNSPSDEVYNTNRKYFKNVNTAASFIYTKINEARLYEKVKKENLQKTVQV